MQYSVTRERACNSGEVKMKTHNFYKNPYKKERKDNTVDQLCSKLQDTEDRKVESRPGMPTCSIEQTEAVRRYYAAFPALKKSRESPLQYYLPPPAWCQKSISETDVKMQSEVPMLKEWMSKNNKKVPSSKERRNSYQGQRKNNKKRCNMYSRSFESKENLPEWVTHEGVWDMETQDPVKEFIRAIALDEGYGTCENTVTDEVKDLAAIKLRMKENMVPDWDDSLDLDTEWVITEDLNPRPRTPMEEELYAKFEAKFDRSIEALWSKDQNTPDDEYQDLPIDFQDLLSSPSDRLFAEPSADKCSLISLTESIWSNDATEAFHSVDRAESPSKIVEVLHDRFKPLNLADTEPRPNLDSFIFYEGEDIYDALSSVAKTMRSFTAINHSRDHSGFVEVPPRRNRADRTNIVNPPEIKPIEDAPRTPSKDREDLLTSSRTHFRPIRRESETEVTCYADGETFDISGELDVVEFRRSDSGGVYLEDSSERYFEYRALQGIDYGKLNLTAAQRCPDLDDTTFRLRFPMRQTDTAVQTDGRADTWGACEECGRAAKKMRPSGINSIWSEPGGCEACSVPPAQSSFTAPPPEELSREWEELLSDISAAHAQYTSGEIEDALVSADRKRRHSAALREAGTAGGVCNHPHARFLHCCALVLDRPLTR